MRDKSLNVLLVGTIMIQQFMPSVSVFANAEVGGEVQLNSDLKVNVITIYSSQITGNSVPGSEVTAKINGKVIGSGTTAQSGEFAFTVNHSLIDSVGTVIEISTSGGDVVRKSIVRLCESDDEPGSAKNPYSLYQPQIILQGDRNKSKISTLQLNQFISGDEAYQVIKDEGFLNPSPGQYEEWLFMEFELHYVSGPNERLEASEVINPYSSFYLNYDSVKIYNHANFKELPHFTDVVLYPGESAKFYVGVLVNESVGHPLVKVRLNPSNSYEAVYFTTDPNFNTKEADYISPTISLKGEETIIMDQVFGPGNEPFVDPGVNVIDERDESVTLTIEGVVDDSKAGTYELIYNAIDDYGNISSVKRTVIVESNNPPEIKGATEAVIKQYGHFNYLKGITAYDKEDGDLTSKIKVQGKVNTAVAGTYQLEYQVSDSDGNSIGVPRVVVVTQSEGIKFSDIYLDDWYYSYIYKFVDKGYLQGYSDGTFRPNNPITRAEFVKVVNRTFGLTTKGNMPFGDVYDEWQKDEISIGVNTGYLSTENKNFRPNDSITREEASKIVGVVGNYIGDGKMTFEDKWSIADYAKFYVDGLVEAGILDNGKKFRPKDNITRAEAVKILQVASEKQ